MIKAILFDLDGTLLDRDKSLIAFLENQYNRIEAFQCIEKQKFIQRFMQLDQKGYVWKDKVYQQLIEELGLDLAWDKLLEDYVESFQRAAKLLGFQPQEIIFVGDHPVNDVEASIKAGMKGVWKEDNYFERPLSDHLSIKDLREIKDILEDIANNV